MYFFAGQCETWLFQKQVKCVKNKGTNKNGGNIYSENYNNIIFCQGISKKIMN